MFKLPDEEADRATANATMPLNKCLGRGYTATGHSSNWPRRRFNKA